VLKKINRIGGRSDFLEIKNNGRLINSPLFGLLFLKKEDKERKIGFVVSKKISKKAVDRNKIRRRLSEVVIENWELVEEGWRLIFLVKKEILNKNIGEIEKEFKKCLKK